MSILLWILFGFVIGLLARAIMPGRQSMGIVMTTLLGIAGSLIGGLVGSLFAGGEAYAFTPSGFIGSLLGALLLLFLAGMVTRPPRERRYV
jgi:uncharacterized membrane protein YeaQ/YmgE (transglycosylase-associated protein family)